MEGTNMQSGRKFKTVTCVLIIAFGVISVSTAEDTPWWPSEWGEDDQRGAANRITPEKVRAASRLVKEGQVYSLGRTYEPGMPLFGDRHYSLTIPSSPTGGPVGTNRVVWHDEMFSGEIGQIGTQFDGLGHVGTRLGGEDIFYNGIRRSDMKGAYGLAKLGVENVGPIYTRGVLIDVAGFKKLDRLDVGYVITRNDLNDALIAQRVRVGAGDVVLVRTGHGTLWMKDNETYNSGAPGIGTEAAKWLAGQKVVMVGSDTWCVEAVPGEKEGYAFRVHQIMLAQNGIYLIENLNLEKLATDKTYEFAFVFSPVPLKGATGSPGNPIAIK
jgi:kynurenine formamidase